MAAMNADVVILSQRTVRPSPRDGDEHRRLDLTPWDLRFLSLYYIQMGILFSKPMGDAPTAVIVTRLFSSFSRALDQFFPLAGRLAILNHEDAASLSISLDCNDQGAEFAHASAPDVSIADILTPINIPLIINSFFQLKGAIGIDGHSLPLVAVQVTELSDGIFIGCSLNHAVADATSFWYFFNSWSAISRMNADHIPNPPILDRLFLDSCPPPIHLPYRTPQEFIRRPNIPPADKCFFHFPARSVAELKAKANGEMGATSRISSLQSLLAHVWRSVTRARGLDPQRETTYILAMDCRSRLNPPIPRAYLGNSVMGASATALAGEVMGRGLGWAAWQLNQAVASKGEAAARHSVESWTKSPFFPCVQFGNSYDLVTGSSPKFDMFGNDFGWGRPVAVRGGCTSGMDGVVTANQGAENGSIGLEVSLPRQTLSVLVKDEEFMEFVGDAC